MTVWHESAFGSRWSNLILKTYAVHFCCRCTDWWRRWTFSFILLRSFATACFLVKQQWIFDKRLSILQLLTWCILQLKGGCPHLWKNWMRTVKLQWLFSELKSLKNTSGLVCVGFLLMFFCFVRSFCNNLTWFHLLVTHNWLLFKLICFFSSICRLIEINL